MDRSCSAIQKCPFVWRLFYAVRNLIGTLQCAVPVNGNVHYRVKERVYCAKFQLERKFHLYNYRAVSTFNVSTVSVQKDSVCAYGGEGVDKRIIRHSLLVGQYI